MGSKNFSRTSGGWKDRLWSPGRPLPFWQGQVLAIAVAALAIAIRVGFDPYIAGVPFITFFLAVVVAVFWGGTRSAVTVVIVTSLFASWRWLFLAPDGADTTSSLVRLFLFILLSTLIVIIIGAHQRYYQARLASEHQAEVLAHEMHHRVANLLQIVQTLIRRSAPNAETPEELRTSLQQVIEALARAQSIAGECPEARTEVRNLITTLLQPFEKARITLDGDDARIPAAAVTPLGLVVFELATNAAKYGALSNAEGRVSVAWKAELNQVVITWTEVGGPSVVPPGRSGFGTTLVKTAIAPGVGGAEIEFPESGAVARIFINA